LQSKEGQLREIGVGCEIDFLFNATKARRPNSADVDAIIAETRQFFLDSFAQVPDNDVVDVSFTNIGLPLHMTDTFTFRFFASFHVKPESTWFSKDAFERLEGFDYATDYKINYVWKATPLKPVERNVFYHTLSVTFRRAVGIKKFNTFRNFESEGKYFEAYETRTSPQQEDAHVYNQKLWAQKVRNGGY